MDECECGARYILRCQVHLVEGGRNNDGIKSLYDNTIQRLSHLMGTAGWTAYIANIDTVTLDALVRWRKLKIPAQNVACLLGVSEDLLLR